MVPFLFQDHQSHQGWRNQDCQFHWDPYIWLVILVTETLTCGFIKVGGRNNPVESELDISLLGAPRQMGEDSTWHSWGFNKPGGDVIIGNERQLFCFSSKEVVDLFVFIEGVPSSP